MSLHPKVQQLQARYNCTFVGHGTPKFAIRFAGKNYPLDPNSKNIQLTQLTPVPREVKQFSESIIELQEQGFVLNTNDQEPEATTYSEIQNGDFFYILSCCRKVVFLQDNTDTDFANYVYSMQANRPRPTRMTDGCYHALELTQTVYRCSSTEARDLVHLYRSQA